MIRVLIIDDDRELCRILTKVIRSENMEADCCFNGKDGLKKLQEEVYQLVILDVMMHDIDGFETLELLRKKYELPILMLTARDDSRSKVQGLRAGADDYLTKPFNMDELIARVVSLTRRYTLFNHEEGPISQHLSFGSLHIDVNNRSVESDNGTFTLPPKEFDILLYLIQNQGRILTKKQIYEQVWGEPYRYDDNTIMPVISRLRKKIEPASGLPQFIHTIKGIGYRFNAEV